MHSIAYISVIHAFAYLAWVLPALFVVGCANPSQYNYVPESITYRTPDWLGGFDYKVRFEPKITGEVDADIVE